jgi:hypothetical protein
MYCKEVFFVIRIKEAIKIINKINFKTIAARVKLRALLPGFFSPVKKTILTMVEIMRAPERKTLISKKSNSILVKRVSPKKISNKII